LTMKIQRNFCLRYWYVLLSAEGQKDDDIVKKLSTSRETIYKRLLEQLKLTYSAKNEYKISLTPEVDVLPSGFRLIYQLLIDNDLRRFDFMYSTDILISEREKMEIGLRLMERGNMLRKEARGLNRTFETSNKNRIAVYFPKENDNISDGKYSYPRAAIHTARELSRFMYKEEMISALGLSIGWGGLMNKVQ